MEEKTQVQTDKCTKILSRPLLSSGCALDKSVACLLLAKILVIQFFFLLYIFFKNRVDCVSNYERLGKRKKLSEMTNPPFRHW